MKIMCSFCLCVIVLLVFAFVRVLDSKLLGWSVESVWFDELSYVQGGKVKPVLPKIKNGRNLDGTLMRV